MRFNRPVPPNRRGGGGFNRTAPFLMFAAILSVLVVLGPARLVHRAMFGSSDSDAAADGPKTVPRRLNGANSRSIGIMEAVTGGGNQPVPPPPAPLGVGDGKKEVEQQQAPTGAPISRSEEKLSPFDPSPITWGAAGVYLPLSQDAISGFAANEAKQSRRSPQLIASWSDEWDNGAACSAEAPECDFFLVDSSGGLTTIASEGIGGGTPTTTRTKGLNAVGPRRDGVAAHQAMKPSSPLLFPTLRSKCCAEHQKLKKVLFFVMDIVEGYNRYINNVFGHKKKEEARREADGPHSSPHVWPSPRPLRAFLDSGTLIAAVRDRRDHTNTSSLRSSSPSSLPSPISAVSATLVPWDTDIDMGLVGGDPLDMLRAFGDGLLDLLSLAQPQPPAEGKEESGINRALQDLSAIKAEHAALDAAASEENKEATRSLSLGGGLSASVLGEWVGVGEGARKKRLPQRHRMPFLAAYEKWWMRHRAERSEPIDGAASAFESLFPSYRRYFTSSPTASFPLPTARAKKPLLQAPSLAAMARNPPHYYEPCVTKRRKPSSSSGKGGGNVGNSVPSAKDPIVCKDAHYIYYADSRDGSIADTSHVEFYPFAAYYGRPLVKRRGDKAASAGNSADAPLLVGSSNKEGGEMDEADVDVSASPYGGQKEGASGGSSGAMRPPHGSVRMLRHPTRPWLHVPRKWVVADDNEAKEANAESPPPRCALWGREVPCPSDPNSYLGHCYGTDVWRRPRTIHWGERDVLPWK